MNKVNPELDDSRLPTVVELDAATRQYLRALKDAGLESVPKGAGRFRFELESVPETASRPSLSGATRLEPARLEPARLEPARLEPARLGPVQSLPAGKEPSVVYEQPARAVAEAAANQAEPIGVQESRLEMRVESQDSSRDKLTEDLRVDHSSYSPSLGLAHRRTELQQLAEQVAACKRCTELVQCRSKTVFGVGNPTPRLVFLGEAPGADEDRQGEPFVGAAGKLLDKIIASCKLSRDQVYILNTIKCRPPGNRNPNSEELENCWAFTERQLEILRPDFICCLGLIATKQLLQTTLPLGQLRQQFHQYRDSRVIVTYHPAYLLRTESAKKFVWEDMKMLMREMGVDISR